MTKPLVPLIDGRSGRERFWVRVEVGAEDECWLWTGPPLRYGHGQVGIGARTVGAHRVAYELQVGDIPEGMHLHHTCCVPACVNPAHLVLLSPSEHAQLHNPAPDMCQHCKGEMVRLSSHWRCRPCERRLTAERRAAHTPAEVAERKRKDRERKRRAKELQRRGSLGGVNKETGSA
jgi:hypothetical protein